MGIKISIIAPTFVLGQTSIWLISWNKQINFNSFVIRISLIVSFQISDGKDGILSILICLVFWDQLQTPLAFVRYLKISANDMTFIRIKKFFQIMNAPENLGLPFRLISYIEMLNC